MKPRLIRKRVAMLDCAWPKTVRQIRSLLTGDIVLTRKKLPAVSCYRVIVGIAPSVAAVESASDLRLAFRV